MEEKLSVKQYLMQRFGFSEKDLNENALSRIYYLHKEDIENKIEFYQRSFNLTEIEIKRIIKRYSSLLGLTEENINAKVEFYKTRFYITETDFAKIIKSYPDLLGLSEGNVSLKFEFYKNMFKITETDFGKMLKTLPQLLAYAQESIDTKTTFYKNKFNISKIEFGEIVKRFPQLLGLSEETINKKAEFYNCRFNITEIEFGKMIKSHSAVLSLNEESVSKKADVLFELGITKKEIIKFPAILTAPQNSLKIKYMLYYVVSGNKDFMENTWTMTSFEKAWARFAFLKQTNGVFKVSNLIKGEKEFVRQFGATSQELMQKFKPTKESIDWLTKSYNALAKQNGDKLLTVAEKDVKDLLSK